MPNPSTFSLPTISAQSIEPTPTMPPSPSLSSSASRSLSDQKLFELCQHYGKMARIYRRKFIGLLPEVNRRRLYEQKGFHSIFEFAAKMAGVSKEQVQRILNLDEKFENKPALKTALTEGKISVNKLARIASIATPENQLFLARQAEMLPQKALEVLVKDIKNSGNSQTIGFSQAKNISKTLGISQPAQIPDGLFEPKNEANSVRAHKIEELKISEKVLEKLSELQNKGIDINELILEFLKKREKEIETKKQEIVREQVEKEKEKQKLDGIAVENEKESKNEANTANTNSRYIPIKIKKILYQEHGTKCSVPNCQKPAEIIHHTARFALSQVHNPYFLAPLCQEHHLIAHTVDRDFCDRRSAAR